MKAQTPENRTPEAPITEEEIPPGDSKKNLFSNILTPTVGYEKKSAYSLVKGCIILLALIWLISFIWPDFAKVSTLTESIFDVLKYVITTALGFFFASAHKRD